MKLDPYQTQRRLRALDLFFELEDAHKRFRILGEDIQVLEATLEDAPEDLRVELEAAKARAMAIQNDTIDLMVLLQQKLRKYRDLLPDEEHFIKSPEGL